MKIYVHHAYLPCPSKILMPYQCSTGKSAVFARGVNFRWLQEDVWDQDALDMLEEPQGRWWRYRTHVVASS
ncbi:hypothetical protein KCU65_g88, partial [Aureobasidium melanogenum]